MCGWAGLFDVFGREVRGEVNCGGSQTKPTGFERFKEAAAVLASLHVTLAPLPVLGRCMTVYTWGQGEGLGDQSVAWSKGLDVSA